jgi:hypothetical protein
MKILKNFDEKNGQSSAFKKPLELQNLLESENAYSPQNI